MEGRTLKILRFRDVTLVILVNMIISAIAFAEVARSQQATAPTDVRELKLGEPIEREISGDATHSYRVPLNRGQYLKIVVEQKGMDVIARLFGPDGQKLSEINSPNGSQGPELVSVIADTAGEYRVDVKSAEEKAPAGRYEITLKELRESTAKDRDLMAAERAFAEGEQFRAQGTAESLRKAIEKYEAALPLWRKVGDKRGEASTLNQIGDVYNNLSESQKALEYFNQALPLSRAIEDRRYDAITLNNIGSAYWRLGELQKALDYFAQALKLNRAVGARKEEASSLSSIGEVYYSLGELQKALEYFNQSLSVYRLVGDRQGEASSLTNIGVVYDSLGELQKTLGYYDQALPLLRSVGDHSSEGVVLNNIGYTYSRLGELQKALEYYAQSLQVLRLTGNRFGEAFTLDNIGKVYHYLSEPQKALEYFGLALEIRRAIADRAGQATTLHNIGEIYTSLVGDHQRALEYFSQSLSIRRAVGDRREEAYTLDSIGGTYFSLGELQKALDYHTQSLALRRAVGDKYGEAYALANLGLSYQQLGQLEKSLEYFAQALSLRRTVGDRIGETATLYDIGSTYGKLRESSKALEYYTQALALSRAIGYRSEEAAILLGSARAQRERGNIEEARGQVEAALNIIESTRVKFVSPGLRSTYLASKQDYYGLYIDLLMQMHKAQPSYGYDAAALQASERARARTLLEILSEARVDIRQGVDAALLERERLVQQRLNAQSEALTRLLSGKHSEDQASAAKKGVEDLLTEYQDVAAQIRAKSPRYAALIQPQPLSTKEIQQLLDKETLLLEYALGDERSYVWAVTPTSIKSFELPKRTEIEAEAQRFYKLITSNENRAVQAQSEAAAALSKLLLGPVARELGQNRLVIVSDGALHYIPFAGLPIPLGTKPQPVSGHNTSHIRNTSRYKPLIIEHEIVQLSSASVLRVLREHATQRTSEAKVVAVLADPVFQSVDPRVKGNKASTTDTASAGSQSSRSESESDVKRSGWESGLQDLQRLPFSRREAEAIVTFAPAGQSLKVLDFDASRATVTSNKLADYRIIHFATHGLLNNVHPELSGMVLSLVDQNGRAIDGFLRLHEIYNLNLSADLVVLSGCQTALGKEVKGEGLIGLTRGFMYAGAPRVVVSLWDVNDEATAELMKNFYERMLKKQMPPAAALRAAQLAMWKSKWWNAPYYWAGFVVQGEWR